MFLTIFILLLAHNASCAPVASKEDTAALLDFKNSNKACGSEYPLWSGNNACSWVGVRCGPAAQVINVFLPFGKVCGPLPASWSQLTALQSLYLFNNNITGPLPASWSQLTALQSLYLSNTNITGPLPASWSQLTALQSLALNDNNISGPLPDSWSQLTALQSLDLNDNKITGPLPASWSQLTALAILVLNNNNITGPLPDSWSRLVKLTELRLSNNNVTGPLPASWNRLTALTYLVLNSNYITGLLPASWSQLNDLSYMNMSTNKISGPLPAPWSMLVNLNNLFLDTNNISGPLPASWSRLVNLNILVLDTNILTGPLPVSWSRLAALQILRLGTNQLTGMLPVSWGGLSSLNALDLHGNQLHGLVPNAWLGAWWSQVVFMDVSDNGLNGSLPALPADVQYFNASDNAFTGSLASIPASLVYLHVGSNMLYGQLPDIGSDSLVFVNLDNNYFTALPQVFQAPACVYFSAANNSLSGAVLGGNWLLDVFTSLTYLDLSSNSLTGSFPNAWTSLNWSYLALDNNKFPGSLLSDWSGPVSVLLLHENTLTGPVPSQWGLNSSVKVLSLHNNTFSEVLPDEWASENTFGSLSLLTLDGNNFTGAIPFSWLAPGAFSNATILYLGKLWSAAAGRKGSLLEPAPWRRKVCISAEVNQRLSANLDASLDLGRTSADLARALNAALSNLTRDLTAINVTKEFSIPTLDLHMRLDRQPTLDDICGNPNALSIVTVQWSIVGGLIVFFAIIYVVESNWQSLSKLASKRASKHPGRRETCMAALRRLVAAASSVQFLASMLLYWYDVITDVLILRNMPFNWPFWALLGSFLFHYLVAAAIVSGRGAVWGWWPMWSTPFVWVVMLPIMPMLDTATFVWLLVHHAVHSMFFKVKWQMFQAHWQALFDMRRVTEFTFEAVPTACLQSVIFVAGNRPNLGVYLETDLYVLSMVGSSCQIVYMVGMVLWVAAHDKIAPWKVAWDMVTCKMSDDGTTDKETLLANAAAAESINAL